MRREALRRGSGPTGSGRRGERALLDFFERLAPEQQDKLIAFAEFLVAQAPAAGRPVVMPREPGETITMAIRRLTRAYPMLERRKLMVDASRLMAQHALEGRDTAEIIDELEVVFARHYQKMQSTK